MKLEFSLMFCLCVLLMACGAYKEFEKTPEHERRVIEVRNQRYKAHGFIGKWKEYQRQVGKRNISFVDTIRYDFYGDSSVHIYDGQGRVTKAQSKKLKNGHFLVGSKTRYKSLKMRNGIMTLVKKKQTHYLKKVERFYLAPVTKVVPTAKVGNIGTLDALFLQGKWKIYKKTDPNFSRQKTYLQKMEIGQSLTDGTYEVITYYNTADELVKSSATMSINHHTLSIINKMTAYTYTVIEARDDELLLKDGKIIYFLKKVAR